MHYFEYKNGILHAEDVDLNLIADKVGTPAYVYSQATLERHMNAFLQALQGLDSLVCYAVKANTNKAIIALFAGMGAGADIVSGGELARAVAAGVDPAKVVYSGVGKTTAEMAAAIEAGILMFNVESVAEMHLLNQVAGEMGAKAPMAIRVNPDVDAATHPKITTGLAKNKFGMDVEKARQTYLEAAKLPNLEPVGVSCHIGSQLTTSRPFGDALDRVADLLHNLRRDGLELKNLDLGGGLGIRYNAEEPPTPNEYITALRPTLGELGMRLILEPGRVLVGNAGVFITRVLYTKTTPAKRFTIVDGAMNDLVRPAFYDSYHHILPVVEQRGGRAALADMVGPICETGDFLARDREMPLFEQGDLAALMSAGAYGFTMSSQYNSRPRAAEVMVNGGRFAVVRKRETVEDLSRGESLAPWME